MNRTEYENTLRDLLGIPTLSVKNMLPEDGRRDGLDKLPDALELSHIQLSRYLEASDKALRQAVVHQADSPETVVCRESVADQWSGRGSIGIHQAAPLLNGKLAPGLTTVVRGNPVDDPGNTHRAANFDGEAESMVIFSSRLGDALTADSFRRFLGTQLERYFNQSFGVVTPKLQLAWMHEFADTHQSHAARFAGAPAGSGSFVIQGVDAGRDWLIASAGLNVSLHSNVSLFGGYNGQFNQEHALHTGSGGVEYRW